MIKVFLDDTIKIESIKRYDIKNRAIISIIEDLRLKSEIKWIKYETFKNYELKLLKDNYKENSDLEINNLYKEINYDLEEKADKNNNDNNNQNIINQNEKNGNEDDFDLDFDDIKISNNNINVIVKDKEELENKNDEDMDIEDLNEECLKSYNNYNLYRDITNNFNNLDLNDKDSNSDKGINGQKKNNKNTNNNIINNDSPKPIKRKSDCNCIENGIKCIHNKNDFDNCKVKKYQY